jgi:hypothetical protein
MSEQEMGNNWMGRGVAAGAGCGGLGLIGFAFLVVLACMVGLVLWYGAEGSRADRAASQAIAENAQAAARASEARAEVDKRQIQANQAIALQAQQFNHELERAWQSQEAYERTYALALLAVSRLDKREMRELNAQLCKASECSNPPGNRAWEIALAVVLAIGVFAVFQWLRVYWGLGRRRRE